MKLTLGSFIATLRKEKNLTQREFAEMLSVSDKTVSHWECDKTSPDISLLPVIADIFGITVDELLRGEKNIQKNTAKEAADTSFRLSADIAFNKFRTKNFISIALTLIAVLCGLLVSYFKTIYAGYIVFLALMIVPLLLTAVFRGNFSSYLVSPDADTEVLKLFSQKANRITLLSLYFTFICFIIYSCRLILFSTASVELILLILIASAGLILLCEYLLRKKDLLSRSGKSVQIRKKLILKILCTFLCVLLLYDVYVSHMSIDAEIITHNNAGYTVLSEEDFITLIETDRPAPEKLYRGSHFLPDEKGSEYTFYKDFLSDSTSIEVIGESDEVVFIYNNLEIADYTHTPEGFRVYTHAQMLEAEKETAKEISRLTAIHIYLYSLAVIFSVVLYLILKRIYLSKGKAENITIKDF